MMFEILQNILQQSGISANEFSLWRGSMFLGPHEARGLLTFLKNTSAAEIKKMHELIREKSAAFREHDIQNFSRIVAAEQADIFLHTSKKSGKKKNERTFSH